MANRDDIIAKIRAMRAKAEDHAATEAEAMAAAEMAAKLLIKHDIKPEELAEVAKSEGVVSGTRQGKVLHPVAQYTAWAIQEFTETRGCFFGSETRFIGLEEDVMMAVYLIEMLVGAAKRAWVSHSEENNMHKLGFVKLQTARVSFFYGFAARVSQRLTELKEQRDSMRKTTQGSSNATALVVVKSEVIRRTMEEQGIVIKGKVKSHDRIDYSLMKEGMRHGDTVNLGRPINGKHGVGEIE